MSESKEEFEHRLDGTKPKPVEPASDVAQPHPRQKQAMEVFEKFQKNRRMNISVDISSISRQLSDAAPVSQFPEELFVAHFLPLFAGEVPETAEINYRTWIDKVAAGERMSVEIVNDKNEVLFTIPPMFDTSIIEQAKPGGPSMTLIERHYSRLKEFDVQTSQTFLNKTLSGLHVKAEPTKEVFNNIHAWNQIFVRYGRQDKILDLISLRKDPVKDRASIASPQASDLSDYELDTD